MMAAAFAALGLPHRYVLADVAPDEVPAAVAALRAADAGGANVTVPHKAAVAALVDELSRTRPVRQLPSTVVVRDGSRLVGHNTDLPAHRGRAAARCCPDGIDRAVVLGAGGAGRAVQLALAHVGAGRVSVLRRSDGSLDRLAEELAGADLLVNATPVGTGSDDEPRPGAGSCVRTWRSSTSSTGPAPRGSCARRARPARPRRQGRASCSARPAARWSSGSVGRPRWRRCARPWTRSWEAARMPDAIVLVGLSGSGKSTVGRLLARQPGRPLLDLDADIESREGAHPAHLIRERGEAALPGDRIRRAGPGLRGPGRRHRHRGRGGHRPAQPLAALGGRHRRLAGRPGRGAAGPPGLARRGAAHARRRRGRPARRPAHRPHPVLPSRRPAR